MSTPKGDKQAGSVYIDVADMLNNKIQEVNKVFTLEKCPVKDSTVQIAVKGECIGEKEDDNKSVVSATTTNIGEDSMLQSIIITDTTPSKVVTTDTNNTKTNTQTAPPAVFSAASSSEVNSLKEELSRSKANEKKLQDQLKELKSQNQQHEKELEKMRKQMEVVYQMLKNVMGDAGR